jgi:hypothetical protein
MKSFIALLFLALSSVVVFSQQSKTEDKVILFAVLNAGGTLEPIAFLKEGEFKDSIDGAQEPDILKAFHERYFRPKTAYQLVFGGANAGTVTVKSSDPTAECERHTAHAIVSSTRAKMSATVMGLAVSPGFKVDGSGTRRAATPLEKTEIESLVREEFAKNKVSAAALRKLRSRNLTAVDVNEDDLVEFVGTYWVAPTTKTRSLLFFIAEKFGTEFQITYSDFGTVRQEDTMSDDITVVDTGVGHEMLLDVLDFNNDGVSEIFTYEPSFEGGGFNAYRKQGGKWTRVYEGANYRCAF